MSEESSDTVSKKARNSQSNVHRRAVVGTIPFAFLGAPIAKQNMDRQASASLREISKPYDSLTGPSISGDRLLVGNKNELEVHNLGKASEPGIVALDGGHIQAPPLLSNKKCYTITHNKIWSVDYGDLEVDWSVHTGTGNNSISKNGDRIYVTTTNYGGKGGGGLFSLDEDGSLNWHVEVENPVIAPHTYYKSGIYLADWGGERLSNRPFRRSAVGDKGRTDVGDSTARI